MFGMLDYRARKLYFLLSFPLLTLAIPTPYLAMLAAPIPVLQFDWGWHWKVMASYVLLEVMCLILLAVIRFGYFLLDRVFFWLIDVIPSYGCDTAEARLVVLFPAFPLNKKIFKNISEWTCEDTIQYCKLYNWRIRIFFNLKSRIDNKIEQIRKIYESSPDDFDEIPTEWYKEPIRLDFKWYESLLAVTPYFRSAAAIMVYFLVFI